jgi:NAD(P)H-dependent FMN reductase
MDKLKIPVILGTGRHGRMSEFAALYVHSLVQTHTDIDSTYIDAREYQPKHTDDEVDKSPSWNKIAESSDAFIIVAPEYNHSFPGELKLFLDQAYKEYAYKPAAVVGVSSGGIGGARMVEQLRIVLIALRLIPINNAVYISNVKELFGEDGSRKHDGHEKQIRGMLNELIWFAKVMREGRTGYQNEGDT